MRHNALVLSGGGAQAAYEVGVLKALITGATPFTRHRRLDPDIVTGTSAGSFNGALYVARWAMDPSDAIAEIERVWLDEVATQSCGNGVYRWRGSPLAFLDLACIARNPARFFWERVEDAAFLARQALERSAEFLRAGGSIEQRLLGLINIGDVITTQPFPNLIRRSVDFMEVRRSDVHFQAIATNWRTGELREFHNEDLDDLRGPLILMASSAIPGIFPPVDISDDVFVDGGVLMNTPLAPAIHAGATDLHVVYSDPDIRRIPISELETTFGTLQRTLAISWAAVVERDIRDAERINRALDVWEETGPVLADDVPGAGKIAEIVQDLQRGRRLRRLAIHLYRPTDPLTSGAAMLDFSAGNLRRLIDNGFHDAVAHDCRASGCVVPPGGPDEPEERMRQPPSSSAAATAARGPAPSSGSAA